MGMDVYGKDPIEEVGRYFNNDTWRWRPLANYCAEVAPEICARCRDWHTNDGQGLGEDSSRELAKALQTEIVSGRCAQYAAERELRLATLPDEPCYLCDGTGVRKDRVATKLGFPERVISSDMGQDHPRLGQKGWCNGCDGTGNRRPWECVYPFSVKNVQNWVNFLYNCGGFEIY